MHSTDTIDAIACEFAITLRGWATKEEWQTMRETNAKHARNGTVGICASHDYCDANVAMEEAFERVIGRDALLPSDGCGEQCAEDMRAWNAAWTLAKARYLTA